MKKTLPVMLILILSINAYAQLDPAKEYFGIVNWSSRNGSDIVSIQNGTGMPLMIHIIVEGSNVRNTAGINIRNCGSTTHVSAGSSVVCLTSDSNNPVNFNSDSGTYNATGTYQIKQP